MENNNFRSLQKGVGMTLISTAEGVTELLEKIGACEIKLLPVDAETSAILGRTISWAAVGAGLAYFSTTSAPIPVEARIGAVVAGALIGAGTGYFTATHKIRIARINPGDTTPVFSIVIDPC